jgi:predicted dehydrogenase
VDVVYVGTPHTLHHRNTKDALLAGKHVLCEKPFTLDLAELDELIALAKEKKRFLMEWVPQSTVGTSG